jgi:hypothetical protein
MSAVVVLVQALGTSARVRLTRESSKQRTTDQGHMLQIRHAVVLERGRNMGRSIRPFTGQVLAPGRSDPVIA